MKNKRNTPYQKLGKQLSSGNLPKQHKKELRSTLIKNKPRKLFSTQFRGVCSIIILLSILLTVTMLGNLSYATPLKNNESMKIVNHENSNQQNDVPYRGVLRVYIVEPTSYINMNNGTPYHNGFVGFAFHDKISINYLEHTWYNTTWMGDVQQDNVIVMAAVFNQESYLGYGDHFDFPEFPFEAHYVDAAAAATPGSIGYNAVFQNFSHTVFLEECTSSTCHYCPVFAGVVDQVYQSGHYPFLYTALIGSVDENLTTLEQVGQRWYDYNLVGVPTGYADGGYITTSNITTDGLQTIIEDCGQRDVHDLNLSLSVHWEGNGTMMISVSIQNNEQITTPILTFGNVTYDGKTLSAPISNVGTDNASNITYSIMMNRSYSILRRWIDDHLPHHGFRFDHILNHSDHIDMLAPGQTIPLQIQKGIWNYGKVDIIIITANGRGHVAHGVMKRNTLSIIEG